MTLLDQLLSIEADLYMEDRYSRAAKISPLTNSAFENLRVSSMYRNRAMTELRKIIEDIEVGKDE